MEMRWGLHATAVLQVAEGLARETLAAEGARGMEEVHRWQIEKQRVEELYLMHQAMHGERGSIEARCSTTIQRMWRAKRLVWHKTAFTNMECIRRETAEDFAAASFMQLDVAEDTFRQTIATWALMALSDLVRKGTLALYYASSVERFAQGAIDAVPLILNHEAAERDTVYRAFHSVTAILEAVREFTTGKWCIEIEEAACRTRMPSLPTHLTNPVLAMEYLEHTGRAQITRDERRSRTAVSEASEASHMQVQHVVERKRVAEEESAVRNAVVLEEASVWASGMGEFKVGVVVTEEATARVGILEGMAAGGKAVLDALSLCNVENDECLARSAVRKEEGVMAQHIAVHGNEASGRVAVIRDEQRTARGLVEWLGVSVLQAVVDEEFYTATPLYRIWQQLPEELHYLKCISSIIYVQSWWRGRRATWRVRLRRLERNWAKNKQERAELRRHATITIQRNWRRRRVLTAALHEMDAEFV
eukprot:Sspe_Gene.74049::Locus_45398_Transcript_2_4_Confidence_0.375_Length_1484::g.74049::m.74049